MARARRSSTSRAGRKAPGAFPLVVALLSTAAALALFFSATVPAIAEYRELDEVDRARRIFQRELSGRLRADALHRISLEIDLQSLLVELDRRGVDAESLLSELGLIEAEEAPVQLAGGGGR